MFIYDSYLFSSFITFQDKSAALRYVATCSGPGPSVEYLTDPTLPQGWKCQKIQDSIYYFSPRGER